MVRHLKSLAGAQQSLKDAGAGGGVNAGAATYYVPGTYSLTVPDGVTSVSAVAVGGGQIYSDGSPSGYLAGGSSSLKRGASTLCLAPGGGSGDAAVRDGGADAAGLPAAGYPGGAPINGKGGSYAGSGIGLWGQGAAGDYSGNRGGSGGGEGVSASGTYTMISVGGRCGGAAKTTVGSPVGGSLSYANDIPVTPGETLTVEVGAGAVSTSSKGEPIVGGDGGVNIVWGMGSFPDLSGVTVDEI